MHYLYSVYILHSNYQHQLCIPWVARLCLTVVSCWKCLYTLITPQAFTCARTRKESMSCRSTASAKGLFPPKLPSGRKRKQYLNMIKIMMLVAMMMMMMMIIVIIIIIIIIVIIKIIKIIIIIIIIITVLDLLSFQGKVQKKNAGNTCTNEWTC